MGLKTQLDALSLISWRRGPAIGGPVMHLNEEPKCGGLCGLEPTSYPLFHWDPDSRMRNRQALNVDLMWLNSDISINLKPGLGGHRGLGRVEFETIMVALEVLVVLVPHRGLPMQFANTTTRGRILRICVLSRSLPPSVSIAYTPR